MADFRFVADQEAEQPEPFHDRVGEYVHVVTTPLFDITRVFMGRDDALHYALQILKAIDQAPVLTFEDYREQYGETHHTIVKPADRNCMVSITVRKLRIRRDKCYILGKE